MPTTTARMSTARMSTARMSTARMSTARGRPPPLPGGIIGSTRAHCASVRSVG
jgi:hypothetical protein